MKVETNGRCTCYAAYTGDRCMSCNAGHKGDTCNICDVDYIKVDQDTCQEGECFFFGTEERGNDGTCLCLPGYISAKCDNCDTDHYMNTDDGTCLQGACHKTGTKERLKNGTCQCEIQFKGMNCHDCAIGYEGKDCDKCHSDYHKSKNLCLEGPCDSDGTYSRDIDGTCICKPGFTKANCDTCDAGHEGKLCDQCIHGFSMYNGLCKGHKFLLATGEPGARGKYTQIIDITTNQSYCRPYDFPTNVKYAEGGLIHGTTPLICGGQTEDDLFNLCWYLKENKWKKGTRLAHGRKFMGKGSIIYKNKLLISGGEQWVDGGQFYCLNNWFCCTPCGPTKYYKTDFTKTQELVGKSIIKPKVENHLNFSTYLVNHCNIQIDSNKILVTGGRPHLKIFNEEDVLNVETIKKNTFVMDLDSGKVDSFANMYDARMEHQCTKVTLSNGKEVALVAGGTGIDQISKHSTKKLLSVEFLPLEDLGDAQNWQKGIELPYTMNPGMYD